MTTPPIRRAARIAVLALSLVVLASGCSDQDGSRIKITEAPSDKVTSTSTTAASTTSPEPTMPTTTLAARPADTRLAGKLTLADLDLSEPIDSDEIASVLAFAAGAGGIPDCEPYFYDEEPGVAPGVAFAGDTSSDGAPLLTATVGWASEICLTGWGPDTIVTLVDPVGASITFTVGSDEPSVGAAVSLHSTDWYDETLGRAVELRTYAGAALGTYGVRVEEGGRQATFDFQLGASNDPTRPGAKNIATIFNIDRYADSHDLTPLDPSATTAFSAIGYPPGVGVDLAIFRTEVPADDSTLVSATLRLVDRIVLPVDDRGEGSLVFDLDPTTAGHCYFGIDVADLSAADLSEGLYRNVSGQDAQTFCVAP